MLRKKRFSVMLSMTFLVTAMLVGNPFAADESYVVEDGTALIYTVKEGDTLWDLSRKFFDSPWVWPELWSKNAQINNPHVIYPGQKIKLYKRSDTEVIGSPSPDGSGEQVLKAAPEQESSVNQASATQPEPETRTPAFSYTKIDQIGFLRKAPVNIHGVITKSQASRRLLSDGDILYVQQTAELQDPMVPGRKYSVFRPSEKQVKDSETGTVYGTQYDLKGVVEIAEVVSQNPVVAIARVVQTFREILVNDRLMPYEARKADIEIQRAPEGLKGKIIASMDQKRIFGEGEIVFIDKGEKDGVAAGQSFDIYYDEKLGGDLVKEIDLGTLIVLHTEQETSTSVITRSNENTGPGARIKSSIME